MLWSFPFVSSLKVKSMFVVQKNGNAISPAVVFTSRNKHTAELEVYYLINHQCLCRCSLFTYAWLIYFASFYKLVHQIQVLNSVRFPLLTWNWNVYHLYSTLQAITHSFLWLTWWWHCSLGLRISQISLHFIISFIFESKFDFMGEHGPTL